MLDLTHVDAKLGRAEIHLEEVKKLVLEWTENKSYRVFQRFNEGTTKLSLVVEFSDPPKLLDWTLILADCINNLRTALDYLVYAIAVHESGKNPPPEEDKLAFIIADDSEKFRRNTVKLGQLSPAACHAIESVQPYHRTNPAIPPPLAILRTLSNTDKHRMLRLAATTPSSWDLHFAHPTDSAIKVNTFFETGEVTNGTEIAWAISSKPNPQMRVFGSIGLCIAIWHGSHSARRDPGSDRSDFSALFDSLVNEVRAVVKQISSVLG